MNLYSKYGDFLKEKFNCAVRKITVDAGFSCPNRDGSLSSDGCVFCDNHAFSPALTLRHLSVKDQVLHWLAKNRKNNPGTKYLAYFQPFTNTHKPAGRLDALYRQALCHEDIVGIAIGTRPDCIDEEKADIIASIGKECYVSLEIGVQSIHENTLKWMNRGHGFDAVRTAATLCSQRGIDICFHVILGFPGEGPQAVRETAITLAELGYQSVKIHNLHVCRNTELENRYYSGNVRLPELKEYAELVADFLERTPETVTVQRLLGDAAVDYLVAPDWSLDKQAVLKAIDREFEKRGSRQGVFAKR